MFNNHQKMFFIFVFSFLGLFSLSSFARLPNPARTLATEMCNLLYGCDSSLSRDLCITAVFKSDELLNNFGGPDTDGTGEPFRGVDFMLRKGTLSVDVNKLLDCISEIQSYSCTSAYVQAAWSSSNPTDFSNLENMIDEDGTPSCGDVFH